MALPFAPGDDLIFQLESGYGLLRVLAVEERAGGLIWHLLAYEELFLDVESAEALEEGLSQFTGTVVAVTHDRWFLRNFDRFVVFGDDATVTDHLAVPAAWR